ncbi:MAG: FAD-dependent thymidylate synthase [Bacilli bacterium]|nr:FAD-dependent thymidylate synthase [Bacilli bacterium]
MITNINEKTLQHIFKLRECTKAQWKTRNMAIQMHKEIDKIAPIFSQILRPSCQILGICPKKRIVW